MCVRERMESLSDFSAYVVELEMIMCVCQACLGLSRSVCVEPVEAVSRLCRGLSRLCRVSRLAT